MSWVLKLVPARSKDAIACFISDFRTADSHSPCWLIAIRIRQRNLFR